MTIAGPDDDTRMDQVASTGLLDWENAGLPLEGDWVFPFVSPTIIPEPRVPSSAC
jgi:hypothetical protein